MRVKAVRMLAAASAALLLPFVAPGTPASAARADIVCDVTPQAGRGTINVRNQASTSSPIVDYLQQGEYMDSDCTWVQGGSYTACGGTSSEWIRVHYYLFAFGYVARRCVTLSRHNV